VQEAIKSRSRLSAEVLALATLYVGCGLFGLSLAFVNVSVSAFWPPTGLALAALLWRGPRLWPGVFLGAAIVNFIKQGSLLSTVGIATGNTLEALAGAWLVMRFAGGLKTFDNTKTIFAYVLLAAIFSTAISATFGVTSLCLGGFEHWDRYGPVWATWWLGDMVSDLTFAPLLLIWLTQPFEAFKPRRLLEAAGLLLLVVVVGTIVFFGWMPLGGRNEPLEYLTIPPLLWAAFRFGERGAITAASIMSGIALWGTRQHLGPFARLDSNESLLLLQAFMGTITLTALVLAVVVSERRRAEQRLQVQDAVSRALTEAHTLREAAPKILQALCEKTGYDVGALWKVDPGANGVACVDLWHIRELAIPEFEELTRQSLFGPGQGLPGRVWSDGQPVWIADVVKDSNFPRAAAAAKEGLRAAFCFPLRLGSEINGLIECLSRRACEPDENFLRTLTEIGTQVGQFIERKHAEEALRRSEALLRQLADAMPQIVWTARADGYIDYYNQRWYEFTGFPESYGEESWKPILHPDDVQRCLDTYFGCIREGRPYQIEYRFSDRHQGGFRWFLGRALPVKDESGKIIRWFGTCTDIDDVKQAEEAQSRLAAIVQSSEDAIVSKTLEGIITSWNRGAENIFGYSAGEMIGRPISILIPSERMTEESHILERLRRGEPVHYLTERLRKDGSIIDISLTVSPIRDGSGNVIGVSKIARNITEQRKTERALSEAQQVLREHAENLERRVQERTAKLQDTIRSLDGLCYSIAHDLRAPLRAMGGLSNALVEDYGPILGQVGGDYVNRIKRAAGRMDQLISDLLEYGRLDSVSLALERLDLSDAIHQARVPLDDTIQTTGAELQIREPLLPMRASTVILQQVLQNLLANALKFVPPQTAPRVEIWTEERGRMVRLCIQDNGIGIKREHVKKLFQPFSRLVNGAEYPGTGIGLAIVRKGVERMGGRVGVNSKLGAGCCFWIELPTGLPGSL
jgi:PAS domain S-box-containing protein